MQSDNTSTKRKRVSPAIQLLVLRAGMNLAADRLISLEMNMEGGVIAVGDSPMPLWQSGGTVTMQKKLARQTVV